ncbi:unnamed protein product [Microthlaspi erraticum]|uniref:Uncharacterized protein n=1 Tax=Microthlaspi erraticum TaxID=1685480 RepID=A0A6D2JXA1_9BRAS|nr:unnamed protein product [Microthlaspi erraticum]
MSGSESLTLKRFRAILSLCIFATATNKIRDNDHTEEGRSKFRNSRPRSCSTEGSRKKLPPETRLKTPEKRGILSPEEKAKDSILPDKFHGD